MNLEELIKDYDENTLRTIVFDKGNANWAPAMEYNLLFLKAQEAYLNTLLYARGHVFLNEVHDMLSVPRTQHGALTGWVIGGRNDRIKFGVVPNDNAGHILIDVTVDGVIFDKI